MHLATIVPCTACCAESIVIIVMRTMWQLEMSEHSFRAVLIFGIFVK